MKRACKRQCVRSAIGLVPMVDDILDLVEDGTDGQVLTTDGAGTIAFQDPTAGLVTEIPQSYTWNDAEKGGLFNVFDGGSTARMDSGGTNVLGTYGINSTESFDTETDTQFNAYFLCTDLNRTRFYFSIFTGDNSGLSFFRTDQYYGLSLASGAYPPPLNKVRGASTSQGLVDAVVDGAITSLTLNTTWVRFNYNNVTATRLLRIQLSNDDGASWTDAFTTEVDAGVYKFNCSFTSGTLRGGTRFGMKAFVPVGLDISPNDVAVFTDSSTLKSFGGSLAGVETIDASRTGDLKIKRNGVDKLEVTAALTTSYQPLELKDDFIYQNPCFEGYLALGITNPDTVLTDADTPYAINLGTDFVATKAHDFTVSSAGVITYTGARTRTIHCAKSASFLGDKKCRLHTWVVSSNVTRYPAGATEEGITLPAGTVRSSVLSRNYDNNAGIGAAAAHFFITMDTGDSFQLYAASTVAATTLTYDHLNVFGMAMPGTIV